MAQYLFPVDPIREYIERHFPYCHSHNTYGHCDDMMAVASRIYAQTDQWVSYESVHRILLRIMCEAKRVNWITLDEIACCLGVHPSYFVGDDWFYSEKECERLAV